MFFAVAELIFLLLLTQYLKVHRLYTYVEVEIYLYQTLYPLLLLLLDLYHNQTLLFQMLHTSLDVQDLLQVHLLPHLVVLEHLHLFHHGHQLVDPFGIVTIKLNPDLHVTHIDTKPKLLLERFSCATGRLL